MGRQVFSDGEVRSPLSSAGQFECPRGQQWGSPLLRVGRLAEPEHRRWACSALSRSRARPASAKWMFARSKWRFGSPRSLTKPPNCRPSSLGPRRLRRALLRGPNRRAGPLVEVASSIRHHRAAQIGLAPASSLLVTAETAKSGKATVLLRAISRGWIAQPTHAGARSVRRPAREGPSRLRPPRRFL
ncbi:hypothetical protein A7982_13521 [Minicystis rosea]|nr:hypothetical protein A7982_13521 [Minicystis rosea]